MSNITFKFLSSDGPARRLSYTSMPTWADLAGKLEGTFAIPKARVALAYIDTDGDEIVLNSDEELRDCVEDAAAMRGKHGNTPNELATVIRCRVLDLGALRSLGSERPSARSVTPAPADKDSDIASSATAESTGDGVHAIQHTAGEGEKDENEISNTAVNRGNTSIDDRPTDIEGDGVSDVVEYIEIDRALRGMDDVSESGNGNEDDNVVLVDVQDRPRLDYHGCARGHHDHHGHRSFRFDPHGRGRGGFCRGGRSGLGRGGLGFGGLGRGGFASTHIPPFPPAGSPPSPPSPGASASPFSIPAPDSPDMHARGMGRGRGGGRGCRGSVRGFHPFGPFGGPFDHERDGDHDNAPPLFFRHEHFHHHFGPVGMPPFPPPASPPPPFVPPPMTSAFAEDVPASSADTL